MRVLLVFAAAAVGVLVWPLGGTPEPACRAPAAGMRTARANGHPRADGAMTAVNPGGETPGMEWGRCALRLRLLDRVTGEPIASNVELWRLDLPEDESWTAGDERHATGRISADGGTFSNVPEGRYRITAHGQSYLAEDDPPAFFVRGAVTDLALPVRAPRSHRVFLRAFNERGREIRAGSLQRHRTSSTASESGDPDWARPRRPKRASVTLNPPLGAGGGAIGRGDGQPDAVWTDAGLDLGRFREDSRGQRQTTRLSMAVPGHTAIVMSVGGRLTGDRTYAAVAVSMQELQRLVLLPDGRRAAAAGALFEASSRAVEVESPLSPDAWRTLPVKVRVALSGYEMLTFEYRVDRPPDAQVMRRNIYG